MLQRPLNRKEIENGLLAASSPDFPEGQANCVAGMTVSIPSVQQAQ